MGMLRETLVLGSVMAAAAAIAAIAVAGDSFRSPAVPAAALSPDGFVPPVSYTGTLARTGPSFGGNLADANVTFELMGAPSQPPYTYRISDGDVAIDYCNSSQHFDFGDTFFSVPPIEPQSAGPAGTTNTVGGLRIDESGGVLYYGGFLSITLTSCGGSGSTTIPLLVTHAFADEYGPLVPDDYSALAGARQSSSACPTDCLMYEWNLAAGEPATPAPQQTELWGDNDCDGDIDADDARRGLLALATPGEAPAVADCPDMGEVLNFVDAQPAGSGSVIWGNVNCGPALDGLDVLAVLLAIEALGPLPVDGFCPQAGDEVVFEQ
jgi:hypothetical protein